MATSGSPSRDLTSLAERFGALFAVRVGLAGAVLLAVAISGREMGVGLDVVGPLTVAYLGVGLAAEGLRRAATVRAVNVQNVMLLTDAVFIALVVAPTGGPRSELMFLFYVHLIAVTLLGTHRTGLRVAIWDAFVFLLIYTFSLRTEISRLLGAPVSQPPGRQVALAIFAFWLVALCTAFFSSVNERELRRSKEEMRVLAEMGADLERSQRPEEILEVLLAKATEAFGFSRGVVLLKEAAATTALASGHPTVTLLAPIEPDRVVRRAWTERGAVLVR
ncbi:MAG TPA: hypothetical protein VLL25_07925, partial [Acidimicrobiales bacterium]|nr:hypothetical protein [Acidimicrobiales bacterium]